MEKGGEGGRQELWFRIGGAARAHPKRGGGVGAAGSREEREVEHMMMKGQEEGEPFSPLLFLCTISKETRGCRLRPFKSQPTPPILYIHIFVKNQIFNGAILTKFPEKEKERVQEIQRGMDVGQRMGKRLARGLLKRQ